MKYLCLVYSDEEKLHTLPESPKDDECLCLVRPTPFFATVHAEARDAAATDWAQIIGCTIFYYKWNPHP